MNTKRTVWVVAVLVTIMFLGSGCAFSTYRKRARQSEAKTNLASIFTVSVSYFAEKNEWGKTFEAIGWYTEGDNRYAYYLNSCDEVVPSKATGYKECPQPLKDWFAKCQDEYAKSVTDPAASKDTLCAGAVYNMDKDPKLDIWVIDGKKELMAISDDTQK